MARIASFHLVRHTGPLAPLQIVRLGLDRRELDKAPGLRFWRLLGTGSGADTGPGADLRRRALFAVWETEIDLDVFLAASPVARRWRRATEAWHVRMRGLGGHGRWRGVDVLDEIDATRTPQGPVAVLTRADVRLGAWPRFASAAREVDAELQRAPGLLDVVGIGEAPVGRQATFSLWESAGAARTFASSTPRHRRVIEETREGEWYGEELFAHFAPFASSGTWDGRDPLAGLLDDAT